MGLVLFVLAPVVLFLGYMLVMSGLEAALAILGLLIAFLIITSLFDVGSGKKWMSRNGYEVRDGKKLPLKSK